MFATGRALHKVIAEQHLRHLSTYESTYWPTENFPIELIDFFVTNDFADGYLNIKLNFNIVYDHTPVMQILKN